MKTNLSINFKNKDELQSFLINNAFRVDLGDIEGVVLISLDKEFLYRFKKELDFHRLFIESIKIGDLNKVKFCLNNGVSYRDMDSIINANLLTIESDTPISAALDYGRPEIIDYFLDEGFLNIEDIHFFVLFIILRFGSSGRSSDKLKYYLELIEKIFDKYEIDPDFNRGQFINNAVDGVYPETMDLLKFLMDDRCNIDLLDIFYIKGHTYNTKGLHYLNKFIKKEDKIDVDFFITGKFSETKDE